MTAEQRRALRIPPYPVEEGSTKIVVNVLAWLGTCSVCREQVIVAEEVDKPDVALMVGQRYNVLRSDWEMHPCVMLGPYRIGRPYDPKVDMAHPMNDPVFTPEHGNSPLWMAGTRARMRDGR